MVEKVQTESYATVAPQGPSGSEVPDQTTRKDPHRATVWLSILATVLAVAAIALTQFDFREATPLAARRSDARLSETYPEAAGVAADANDGREQGGTRPRQAGYALDTAAPASVSVLRSSSPRVRLLVTALELPLDSMRTEAEHVAKRLEQQLPDKPASLHVAALFYAQTRQTAEAEKRWSRCIALAPEVEMYYINLAALTMERGENELAIKTLEQALAAGFTSSALMHHWALALSSAGRFEEAIPVIEKLIEEDANNGAEWLILGKAQLETGELDDAENSLRRSIELGTKTAGAYFALGNTYARLGKKQEAKEFLQLYQEHRPNKSDSTQARFEGLNLSEMRQTTLLILSEAASVYLEQKETLEAERLLLRALAFDPKALGPARTLARLYFDKKMLREERVVRERILEIDPYNFSNYVDCAKVCAQLEEMSAAEAVLKLAMTQRPDAVEPYATLAEFYWQARTLPEARWFAEQALERQPRPEGYRLLATICEAQKDAEGYRQAIAHAERLSKKNKH